MSTVSTVDARVRGLERCLERGQHLAAVRRVHRHRLRRVAPAAARGREREQGQRGEPAEVDRHQHWIQGFTSIRADERSPRRRPLRSPRLAPPPKTLGEVVCSRRPVPAWHRPATDSPRRRTSCRLLPRNPFARPRRRPSVAKARASARTATEPDTNTPPSARWTVYTLPRAGRGRGCTRRHGSLPRSLPLLPYFRTSVLPLTPPSAGSACRG